MDVNKNKVVVEGQEGEIDPAEVQGAPAEVATNTETALPTKTSKSTKTVKESEDSVILRYPGNVPNGPVGGSHRVFSKEAHGEDFKLHAEANRKRFNGEYVDSLPGPKACPTCGRAN